MDKLCITVNSEAPQGMGGTTTGIQTLHSANQQATSVDFYSLSGMRLTAQNAQGLCVAVGRNDAGDVVTRKVVARH
jgi:hypothetical protein